VVAHGCQHLPLCHHLVVLLPVRIALLGHRLRDTECVLVLVTFIQSTSWSTLLSSCNKKPCGVWLGFSVTDMLGRTVAVWTLLSSTLCFLCAFNLSSKPVYAATFPVLRLRHRQPERRVRGVQHHQCS
jgi:hypothetical protein